MKTILLTLSFLCGTLFSTNGQNLPNGDFESWVTVPVWQFEEPENWITSNLSTVPLGLPTNATKVSDAYSGNYALKLETINDPTSDVILGGAVCGSQISGKPSQIIGYYKADIKGIDVPGMYIVLVHNSMPIGEAEFEFEAQSDWTYFEMVINYFVPNLNPQEFTLSAFTTEDNPSVGTSLYLDALSFDGINTTIDLEYNEGKVLLSPNPAFNKIKVDANTPENNLILSLFDLMGKKVLHSSFENHSSIDISKANVGCYWIQISTIDGKVFDHQKLLILE